MKLINIFIVLIFICACANIHEGAYILKASKYYDTYFAEWGENEDGTPFEDRYDGVLFEVISNGKKIGEVTCYQHWFLKNKKDYPKIGEEIKVDKFDYNQDTLGTGKNCIEFNRLKFIKN